MEKTTLKFACMPGTVVRYKGLKYTVMKCTARGRGNSSKIYYAETRTKTQMEFSEEEIGRTVTIIEKMPLEATCEAYPFGMSVYRGGREYFLKEVMIDIHNCDHIQYRADNWYGGKIYFSPEDIEKGQISLIHTWLRDKEMVYYDVIIGRVENSYRVYYFTNGKLETSRSKDEAAIDQVGRGEDIYRKCKEAVENETERIVDIRSFWARCGKYCLGMTQEELEQFVISNRPLFLKRKRDRTDPSSIVLSVSAPIFSRYTNNFNCKTYDMIRVEENLRCIENLREECTKHQNELVNLAIQRIEKSKKFQSYGVPVNFLKIYNMTLTKDKRMVIDFCFKNCENREKIE